MGLKKRTIMIFPEFDNMKCIDDLREKYDPLADKVRPHITLVFPFESAFTENEISKKLNNVLHKIKPFEIKLQGLSLRGRWLLLDVINGTEILTEIHKMLYNDEFAEYKPSWLNQFVPHITVGRFDSENEALAVYEKVRGFNEVFIDKAGKISVEIIGSEEESIIEVEYLLCSE